MCDTNQDNDTVNKQTQTENHIQELEKKLHEYEVAVAENEIFQRKTTVGVGLLDSLKDKQIRMFNKLIDRQNLLNLKYTFVHEQLKIFAKENACIQSSKKQLCDKLNDLKFAIANLNTVCFTLKDKTEKQEKKLSCLIGTIHDLQVKHHQIELKLKSKQKKIVCVRKSTDEKCTKGTELEIKIKAEQVKNKSLQCSKSELQIEKETIVSSLQSELPSLQDQLDGKYIKYTNLKFILDCTQRECETQSDELKKLKKQITGLHIECDKQNCHLVEKISYLKSQVKLSNKKFELNTSTLCGVLTDNSKLVCQLLDQQKNTKELMAVEKSLQREIKQIKQDEKLVTQKLVAKRMQWSNEVKLYDRKLQLKTQENFDLTLLFENQSRELKMLKMDITDAKPIDSQGTSRNVVDTYLELRNDDQIPVNDCNHC